MCSTEGGVRGGVYIACAAMHTLDLCYIGQVLHSGCTEQGKELDWRVGGEGGGIHD